MYTDCHDEYKIQLNIIIKLEYNLNLLNFTVSTSIIKHAEHNRLDFGALLKRIIGNLKA